MGRIRTSEELQSMFKEMREGKRLDKVRIRKERTKAYIRKANESLLNDKRSKMDEIYALVAKIQALRTLKTSSVDNYTTNDEKMRQGRYVPLTKAYRNSYLCEPNESDLFHTREELINEGDGIINWDVWQLVVDETIKKIEEFIR